MKDILTLDVSEGGSIEIDLSVSGTTPKDITVRFVIITPSYEISLNAEHVSYETYQIIYPPLGRIIDTGIYSYKLEVVIDGRRLYVPHEAEVEISNEGAIDVAVQHVDGIKPSVDKQDSPLTRIQKLKLNMSTPVLIEDNSKVNISESKEKNIGLIYKKLGETIL